MITETMLAHLRFFRMHDMWISPIIAAPLLNLGLIEPTPKGMFAITDKGNAELDRAYERAMDGMRRSMAEPTAVTAHDRK